MIDSIEELDLSKENIQPLKRGRIICQLENAIRAQTDPVANQELMREKEKYELRLRTYEGIDPLENWYEYVLWIEQNFPRTAREGNLITVLEKSIKQFKNCEQYHQDIRYIELWLKYIELSTIPLELFKRCFQHGVGKYSALFYVAWAHELENINDAKRANQVLNEGIMNHAHPKEHLEKAQHDLQVRVGRAMLEQKPEIETVKAEQRIALNSLRAYGHKKLVNVVRAGACSQRGTPNILQPVTQNSNRENTHSGVIKVYGDNEEKMENAEFEMIGTHHLAGNVRNEIVTKENFLKPGPWTKKSSRKQTGISSSVIRPHHPQHPAFQLHEDEEVQERKVSTIVCNALKPRKLDMDEFICPLAIFEPEDPTKRSMYCKNKVYAGGSEFTLEELRAMEYLKGNIPKRHKQDQERQEQTMPFQASEAQEPEKLVSDGDFSCPLAIFEAVDLTKRAMYCKNKVYPGNGKEFSLEELRAAEYAKSKGIRQEQFCEDRARQEQNVPFKQRDAEKLLENDFACPGAMSEPFDPIRRIMNCKNKIYPDNGRESSFEELRAAEYAKGKRLRQYKLLCEDRSSQEQNVPFQASDVQKLEELIGDDFCPIAVFESADPAKGTMFCKNKVYLDDDKEFGVELLATEYTEDKRSRQCEEMCEDKLMQEQNISTGISNNQDLRKLYPIGAALDLEEPYKINTHCEKKMHGSLSDGTLLGENQDQSSLHGQSITCDTKEALNIVQGFFKTPDCRTTQFENVECVGLKRKTLSATESIDLQQPQSEKPTRGFFEIYNDDSDNKDFRGGRDVEPIRSLKLLSNFEPFTVSNNENEVDQEKEKSDESVISLLSVPKLKSEPFVIYEENEKVYNEVFNLFPKQSICRSNSNDDCKNQKGNQTSQTTKSSSLVDESNSYQRLCYSNLHSTSIPQSEISKSQFVTEHQDGFGFQVKPPSDIPALPAGCIPMIPSPGMTEEEEKALTGTEDKENGPPHEYVQPSKEKRLMLGILHTNPNFPYDPMDDPAMEKEVDEEEHIENTCNTAAFAIPLPSSTPITCHMKLPYPKNSASESEGEKNSVKSEQNHKNENSAAPNIDIVSNLCTVYETSLEHHGSSRSATSGTNFSLQNVNITHKEELQKNFHREYILGKPAMVKSEQDNEQNKTVEKCCVVELFKKNTEEESIKNVAHISLFRSQNSEQHILEFQQQQLGVSLNKMNQVETLFENLRKSTGVACGTEVENIVNEVSKLKFNEKKHPYTFEDEKDIDPFDQNMIQELLNHIEFPSDQHAYVFQQLTIKIPRFRTGATITLGSDVYSLDKLIGEGSYAKVYKGVDVRSSKVVALKVQKPSWMWEYYISHQIKIRLSNPDMELAFMDIHKAYSLENGSILVTEFAQYGSLLSLINEAKQMDGSFPLPDLLLLHWMVELLCIVETLQKCRIIHGDIKPDNFVIRSIPTLNESSLQLIDMGRGIDMTLFPEGTTFRRVVSTKSFQCIEMQTDRPWTYQTDLYGIAGTMHCLLFGEYMKVIQKKNRWFINSVIPRYNVYRSIWEQFFYTLLNTESCDQLPNLAELKNMALDKLFRDRSNSACKFLENIFHQKKKERK